MSHQQHSPFQHLPSIVIQKIIPYTNHVSVSDRLLLRDRDDVGTKIQKNSIFLSHTCNAWRTVMLGMMYHKCEIYVDADYYLISSRKAHMHNEFFNSVPNPKGIVYVRHLSIITDIQDIALGDTVARLCSINLGDLYFPSVTKLSIVLNTIYAGAKELTRATQNIDAFANYLFCIAPNSVDVDIHVGACNKEVYIEGYASHLNMLAHYIFIKAPRMALTVAQDYLITSDIADIVPTGLCTLFCFVGEPYESLFRLIRLNSQALETLRVELVEISTLAQLIVDDKGTFMRYPYLGQLTLGGSALSNIEVRESFPGAIPFPRLRNLLVYGEYPFGDDVVFRDNSTRTLKFIKCDFGYDTMIMFNNLISTKKFSIPYLEYLETNTYCYNITYDNQYAQALFTFIDEVGCNIKRLHVRGLNVSGFLMKKVQTVQTVQNNNWGQNICDLALVQFGLKYDQVIDLLKILPNLERLTSCISEHGFPEESLEDTSMLDTIYKEYWLRFPKFRIWIVNSGPIENVERCAIYSMLLALACSGFHGIRVGRTYAIEFRETLKVLGALYPFKKYPCLTKRLLPGHNWRRTARR